MRLSIPVPPTILAVLWTLSSGLASEAATQSVDPLRLVPGAHVRISMSEAPEERIRGCLTTIEHGRLLIDGPDPAGRIEIPTDAIRSLEIRTGRDRLRGTAIGAGLGAAAALVAGVALSTVDSGNGANMAMAGAVLVGVPTGVLVGGTAGYMLSPATWQEVPPPYGIAPAR